MNQQSSSGFNIAGKLLKFFKSSVFIGAFIGIVVFSFFATLFHYGVLHDFEKTTLSWRFNYFHSNEKPSDRIVVLGIDNPSIEAIGRWPWDRSVYVKLLEALNFYGVQSTSFDVYFALNNERDLEGDKAFAEAVKKYDNTIMASAIDLNQPDNYYSTEDYSKLENLSIEEKGSLNALSIEKVPLCEGKQLASCFKSVVLKPFMALFDAINYIGLVNISPGELQSEVFKVPLVFKFKDIYLPSLPLATYLQYKKTKKVSQGKDYIVVDGQKIPVLLNSVYLINWYKNPPENKFSFYPTYSLSTILKAYNILEKTSKESSFSKRKLQDSIDIYFECKKTNTCTDEIKDFLDVFPEDADTFFPSEVFKGKFIFIGLTDQAAGSQDLIDTPVMKAVPGVIIHATVLDNILQNDFIKHCSKYQMFLIMLVFCVGTGITVLGLKCSRCGLAFGALYCFYFVIPFSLFYLNNIYIDLFYIQSAIIFTYGMSVAYQYLVVDKGKRQIKQLFSNYLAPQVLNEVMTNPSSVKLGGKRKEITTLFSDIRGFTTISEKNTPEGVVLFLNEFFDAMVEEIIKTEGTVDKFIGDAIMAFWGAPLENDNHPELAIKGALGMSEALERLKLKWRNQGKDYPDINIGIGINTGEAIVGHVGSSKIKSYTIIGDSVNLASRLEGLNKKYVMYGDETKNIIISEYTYQKVKDIFEVVYLDEVKVKGKDIAVKIYKVTGIK